MTVLLILTNNFQPLQLYILFMVFALFATITLLLLQHPILHNIPHQRKCLHGLFSIKSELSMFGSNDIDSRAEFQCLSCMCGRLHVAHQFEKHQMCHCDPELRV